MSTQNPWKTDTPYDVMFDERIQLSGIRTTGNYSLSALAVIFPFLTTDPFADVDTASELERVMAIVKQSDLSCQPQIGDSLITLEDDRKWNVSEVKKEQSWYKLTAKGTQE